MKINRANANKGEKEESIFDEFLQDMGEDEFEFDETDSDEMKRFEKYGQNCIFVGKTGK